MKVNHIAGYKDAAKASTGTGRHARIACLQYNCASGIDISEGAEQPIWLCDGIVPFDLYGGIHRARMIVTPRQQPFFTEAAGEPISFYWEVSFGGTIHLLPPRLLYTYTMPPQVRVDLSNEGLLRAYLNGFSAGVADRLQTI